MRTYSLEELRENVKELPSHLRRRYDKYLLSHEWRKKKEKTHRRDGYRCVVCGHNVRRDTHHLTYERVFVEKISDLVTLCPGCHLEVHRGKIEQQEISPTPNWPSVEQDFTPGQVDEEPCMDVVPISEIEEW